MEGKIMKTKALASYDQLILATKRRSYYGPVPYSHSIVLGGLLLMS